MKQDPILPSIHVSAMQIPPKRMVPTIGKIGSSDHMIGEGFLAILLHGLCVLIALWCMEIPKHDNPLHSTIEIAFETPVALPIPQDVSSIDESDLQTSSVAEPIIEASDSLPQVDVIAQISIPKIQKIVSENKKLNTKYAQNEKHQESTAHTASVSAQPEPQVVTSSMQSASQNLSPSQRCSALIKEYPLAARRRHEQGTTQVSYQILADGQIKQVDVVESSGFSDLDRAAVKAVQSMKCQAAPGQLVTKTSIPVNFLLNKTF